MNVTLIETKKILGGDWTVFKIYDGANLAGFINQFWKRKLEGLFYNIENTTKPKSGILEDTDK